MQEVPEVAVQVFEDGNSAIRLLLRLSHEYNALSLVGLEVAPEVVCVEEKEDPAASLIANVGRLIFRACTGQQKTALARTWGRNDNPALVLGRNEQIFDELEAKRVDIEGKGFVVVADDNGDQAQRLLNRTDSQSDPKRDARRKTCGVLGLLRFKSPIEIS